MKAKISFLLLFLCLTFSAYSQTTITLGNAALSSSSQGPIFVGYSGTPAYSRQIAIYTASEINSAGVTSGILQKIKWYKTDANGYNHNNGQIRIYVKHTAQNTFASSPSWVTEQNGATLVYSSNTQNLMAAIGWQEFALTTPFVWNSVNNLEILVDWVQSSTSAVYLYWQCTPNMIDMNAKYEDSSVPATLSKSGIRPNVQLEFGSNTVSDAGITGITSPVSPVLPGISQPVQVTMRNFGGGTVTSATINWSVNGVLQMPYAWSGNLAPAQTSAPVIIGNYTFPAGNHSVCAWSSLPTGPDFNPHNDSTCITLSSCAPLSGNYTINSGAGASVSNFVSFSAAVQRLNDCGISGKVTFNVAPSSGPYNEQIELHNLSGSSDSVIFEGNGITLTGTPTTTKPAVVLLNGAKRVKFRHLNVSTAGTAYRGYAFQLLNAADFTEITDCKISLPIVNAAADPFHTGIMAGFDLGSTGNFTNNSVFRRNIITGGSTGIRIYGDTANLATQNQISQNQIRDFSTTGIFLNNSANTLITENDLSRPTLSRATAVTFLDLDRGNRNAIISRNRFHNSHGNATSATSGTPAYGVEAAQCKAPAGQENIIKNNLFYDFNTSYSKIALTSTGSEGLYFYHNTIYFSNSSPNSASSKVFSVSAPDNVKIINNIISLNDIGNYKSYVYYFGSQTPLNLEIKSNVLYTNPAGQNYIGFAGNLDYLTLSQWQLAGNGRYDANSLAANPLFANPASGDLKPTAANLIHTGIPLAAVTDDFYGTLRSTTNPDPGAYEFSVPTGLAESNDNTFGVKAFPNPFSQELSLQLTALKPAELRITLLDVLGKTLCKSTKKVAAGSQTISPEIAETLPAGLYILQLELNGMKTQQKLIKQL